MTDLIDLTSYYFTARTGIGQCMRLPTIDARLARFNLSTVLDELALVMPIVEEAPKGPAAIRLANHLLPASVASRAVGRLRNEPMAAVTSSQVLSNLALRALAACPLEAGRRSPSESIRKELGLLAMALGDHLGRPMPGRDSLALEVVRLSLFYGTNDILTWLDLSHALFFDILPQLSGDVDFVDVDRVARDAYGLTLKRLWALTAIQGMVAVGGRPGTSFPQAVEGWSVDSEELGRWMAVMARNLGDAVPLAKADLARGSGWSFEAFLHRPLMQLGPDRAVALRPAWVANRATLHGMFWMIRDPFVNGGGDHVQWSRLFGRAVETLGHSLLARAVDGVNYITESEIKAWGARRQCDAIVPGQSLIAVDFVYRQFTRATTSDGDFNALASDLEVAAVDKLLQIDASVDCGLEAGAIAPDEVFPVVVIGGPFPVNPMLHEDVMRRLEEAELKFIARDNRCMPFALLDLANFYLLVRLHEDLGISAVDLLRDWLTSPMGRVSFRDWATTDGPVKRLPKELDRHPDEWVRRALMFLK